MPLLLHATSVAKHKTSWPQKPVCTVYNEKPASALYGGRGEASSGATRNSWLCHACLVDQLLSGRFSIGRWGANKFVGKEQGKEKGRGDQGKCKFNNIWNNKIIKATQEFYVLIISFLCRYMHMYPRFKLKSSIINIISSDLQKDCTNSWGISEKCPIFQELQVSWGIAWELPDNTGIAKQLRDWWELSNSPGIASQLRDCWESSNSPGIASQLREGWELSNSPGIASQLRDCWELSNSPGIARQLRAFWKLSEEILWTVSLAVGVSWSPEF